MAGGEDGDLATQPRSQLDSLQSLSFVSSVEEAYLSQLPTWYQRIMDGATLGDLTAELDGKRTNLQPHSLRSIPVSSVAPSPPASSTLDVVESGRAVPYQASRPPTSLNRLWCWDSGKCIDASPVALVDPARSLLLLSTSPFQQAQFCSPESARVFIGSHSGLVAALTATSGHLLWQRQLGARIEASLAVQTDLLAVGSYSGRLTFLRPSDGSELWHWETGDAIKATPLLSASQAFLGSHDKRLYALDSRERRCLWSADLGGAVSSRPVLTADGATVIVATLAAQVQAFKAVRTRVCRICLCL